MKRHITLALTLMCAGWIVRPTVAQPADGKQDSAGIDFFEKKIRPVLSNACYKCHSASSEKVKGDLYVDSRQGLLKGGSGGPAIVPGNPDRSALIKAVKRVDNDTAMPPKEKDKLSEQQVADLTAWVKMGAPWPDTGGKGAVVKDTAAEYDKLRKELWSWQPIKKVSPPEVKTAGWVKSPIDSFILAKLEEKNLKPSTPADKASLIRRAYFDVIGLPPSPEEVDAFVRDSSPDAFAKVVDKLLASPQYGERWGRHWLDVARYAESAGMTRNLPYYFAWRYRDYVIKAFNEDKPYDRFLTEQLAGDLLPYKNDADRDDLIIATGFLAIGAKELGERNPRQFALNIADEQIDAVGKAMLATTIACARCHDHKFDPIPTKEYYSLAGIFLSTETCTGLGQFRLGTSVYKPFDLLKLSGYKDDATQTTPIASVEGSPAQQRLKRLKEQAAGQNARDNITLQLQIRTLETQLPPPTADHRLAMGVRESDRPSDTRVLTRGELEQPGETAPRGFLSIPCVADTAKIDRRYSGRLDLAKWITRPDHPLTSRVMANRIWHHLFGQGIVRTTDNFGTSGEKPSHPELLDFLATELVKNGWSVKKTIRQVMLSSVYQQSSTFDRAKFNVDPDNRLVWRMSQRRLEAEAIRDSMLAASGAIDLKPATASGIFTYGGFGPGGGAGGPFRGRGPGGERSNSHRSVYMLLYRDNVPESLEVFDMADPSMVTGAREVTTVAPQALFMLNSSFVAEQSRKLTTRIMAHSELSDAERVNLAYKLTLGRSPTANERARATAFINADAGDVRGSSKLKVDEAFADFCQALMASAEFRYLN